MYLRPTMTTFPTQTSLLIAQYDPSPGLIFSEFICGGEIQPICVYQGPADFTVVNCNNGQTQQQSTFDPASFVFQADPDNPNQGIINQPSDMPLPAVIVDEEGHFTVDVTFSNHPTDQVGQGEDCVADIHITGSGTISPDAVTVHFDQTFFNIHADVNGGCSQTGQTICFDVDFEGTGAPIGGGGGGG
jgi:hypothetical protein